jgi:hypothetical protein
LKVEVEREVVARVFAHEMVDDRFVQELVVVEKIENAGGEDQHLEDAENQQNLLAVRAEEIFEVGSTVGEIEVVSEAAEKTKISQKS